jgi:transposase
MTTYKKTRIRLFGTEKSELRLRAIHLWKSGNSITQIAKDCNVARDTIYRWIKNIDRKLNQSTKRNRTTVDEAVKFRILESYFILKCPSMPHLKRVLEGQFHIQLSISQLRRLLKKWNVGEYAPSAMHDSLIRYQFERAVSLRTSSDDGRMQKTSEKSAERSLRREPLSPPNEEEGAFLKAPLS